MHGVNARGDLMSRSMVGMLNLMLALSVGCSATIWQAKFLEPRRYGKLDFQAPFVKCHTRDGKVYVLTKWSVNGAQKKVYGTGLLYDVGGYQDPRLFGEVRRRGSCV